MTFSLLVYRSSYNYLVHSQTRALDEISTEWILTQSLDVLHRIAICQNRHDARDMKWSYPIDHIDPSLTCMNIRISVECSRMKSWEGWMLKYSVFLLERTFLSQLHVCLCMTEQQILVVCVDMVTCLLVATIESLRWWCITVIWKCCLCGIRRVLYK
jgi:hypothetical protein